MKLHIHDHTQVVVIGAAEFSCDWKDKAVAINYRDRSDGDGDVVCVEVQ